MVSKKTFLLVSALCILGLSGCGSDSAPSGPTSAGEVSSASASTNSATAASNPTAPEEKATEAEPATTSPATPSKEAPAESAAPDKSTESSGTTKVDPSAIKKMQQQGDEMNARITKAVKIPSSTSQSWAPSSVDALGLASQIEQTIKALADTKGTIKLLFQNPDGHGIYSEDLKIANSKQYEIPFVVAGVPPAESSTVANGKFKMVRIGKDWYPQRPLSSSTVADVKDPKVMASKFDQNFTHLIFQGITDGHPAWRQAVSGWQKGEGGYVLKVEERHVPWQSKDGKIYDIVSYRMLAERDPATAKRLGESKIEIVIDKIHNLPVTIRCDSTDKKGRKTSTMWACAYQFKQSFSDKDFHAPFGVKLD